MLNIQHLIDGFTAAMQKERRETQITLGTLIAALEALPEGTEVTNLYGPHSYRGYYDDLAFHRGSGTRPAGEVLALCKGVMGQAFEGYKGGEFVMGALTPVWVANYGDCGDRILALNDDGTIETATED